MYITNAEIIGEDAETSLVLLVFLTKCVILELILTIRLDYNLSVLNKAVFKK